MAKALRNSGVPPRTEIVGDGVRHPELRRVDLGPADLGPAAAVDADVMSDPLHPMHRELMARMSAPVVVGEGLSCPARSAIVFYAAVSAWGLVWLVYEAVTAWL